MLYVYTLFDESRDSYPLMSGVYDSASRNLMFFTFYIKGSGCSIYQIEQNKRKLSYIIAKSKKIVLNSVKQHAIAFDIEHPESVIFESKINIGQNYNNYRRLIVNGIKKSKNIDLSAWRILHAKAAFVYADLQRRGVLYGYKPVYPIWGDTYSGRSKTSGFSVQGLNHGRLTNINSDIIFINFDWVSADMRMVAMMSGDDKLAATFKYGDPYQCLVDNLNKSRNNPITRDEGKILLLKSIYSLDYINNPVVNFYSDLKKWLINCHAKLNKLGYLESVLGRKFVVSDGRSDRSVVNATIQGSVAHAMQACIYRTYKKFYGSILVENHDSLVVTSNRSDVNNKISNIAKIMIRPFRGILDSDPQFPLKVCVGFGYKKWKLFKKFGNYGQVEKFARQTI